MVSRSYTYDALLQLKDAGLVGVSGAAQVGGSNKILDLGSSTANYSGVVILRVSAIEIASSNELYTILIQGSTEGDFSANVENLASIALGATEVRPGGARDSTPGLYELPFVNMQDQVLYRYVRAYTLVSGSVATGINYTADIGQANNGIMP